MATRLITQAQLETLFPNKIQRDAFLEIMGGLVMVDPLAHAVDQLPYDMKAICSIMIETEVRQGPDYGKLYAAYPSVYGAGCLVEGLKHRGYKITKL